MAGWKMVAPEWVDVFPIEHGGYSIAILVSGWWMVIWPRFQKVKKSPTQQNSKSHHETSINRSALCHCLARPKVLKNRVIWCNCNGTLRSWKLGQELDDEQFNPIKSRWPAYLRARWVPTIDINEVLGPYLQLVGAAAFYVWLIFRVNLGNCTIHESWVISNPTLELSGWTQKLELQTGSLIGGFSPPIWKICGSQIGSSMREKKTCLTPPPTSLLLSVLFFGWQKYARKLSKPHQPFVQRHLVESWETSMIGKKRSSFFSASSLGLFAYGCDGSLQVKLNG